MGFVSVPLKVQVVVLEEEEEVGEDFERVGRMGAEEWARWWVVARSSNSGVDGCI